MLRTFRSKGRRLLRASLVGSRLILPGRPLDHAALGADASRTDDIPKGRPHVSRTEAMTSEAEEETVGLDSVVRLRLTSQEKRRLRDEAELAGLTMSEFVRRRIFGRTVVAAVDRVMINELRRIGGLLKHVHVLSGGAYSKDTAAAIAEVQSFISELGRRGREKGGGPG